jgi:hypothetical protein
MKASLALWLSWELASCLLNLRWSQETAMRLRGLIDYRFQREQQQYGGADLPAEAAGTRPSSASRTTGSTMNSHEYLAVNQITRHFTARSRVPRVPKVGPRYSNSLI